MLKRLRDEIKLSDYTNTISTQQSYVDYTKVVLNNAYGSTNLYEQCKLEIKRGNYGTDTT